MLFNAFMDRRDFLKKIALAMVSQPFSPLAAAMTRVKSNESFGVEIDSIRLHLSKYISSSCIEWTHVGDKIISVREFGDNIHEAVMQSMCVDQQTWLDVKLLLNERLAGADDLPALIRECFSEVKAHMPINSLGLSDGIGVVEKKLVEIANSTPDDIKFEHEVVREKIDRPKEEYRFYDIASAAKALNGPVPIGWKEKIADKSTSCESYNR